jgi:hypothetical protein
MHPKPILSPEDADAQSQAAVMTLLLAEHAENPALWSRAALEREIAAGGEFAERDAVERAVRDLAGVGLVHQHGDLILPSRAALHFDGLDCGNP